MTISMINFHNFKRKTLFPFPQILFNIKFSLHPHYKFSTPQFNTLEHYKHLLVSPTGKLRMFKKIFMFVTKKSIWHARSVPDVQNTTKKNLLLSMNFTAKNQNCAFVITTINTFLQSSPQVAHLKIPTNIKITNGWMGDKKQQQTFKRELFMIRSFLGCDRRRTEKSFGGISARAVTLSPRLMFEKLEESDFFCFVSDKAINLIIGRTLEGWGRTKFWFTIKRSFTNHEFQMISKHFKVIWDNAT